MRIGRVVLVVFALWLLVAWLTTGPQPSVECYESQRWNRETKTWTRSGQWVCFENGVR